jgi:hypothetical protein
MLRLPNALLRLIMLTFIDNHLIHLGTETPQNATVYEVNTIVVITDKL